jgi:large subunit ribosomal protein L21
MYAVIETGGKQYRVEVGTELEVELLDVEPGQSITLERVLLVADGAEATVGTPVVDGAAVEAEVIRRDRGDKVIAFKYQPKARRRVKKGHRQELLVLRIADIRFGGKSAAETEGKARDTKATERKRLEEAAARQAAEDAALAAKLAVGAETAKPAAKPAKAATTKTATAKADTEKAAPKADSGKTAKADAATTPAKAAPAKAATKATPKTSKAAPKASASKTDAKPSAKAAKPATDDASTDAAPKRTRTKKDE